MIDSVKVSKLKSILSFVFVVSLASPLSAECVWPEKEEASEQSKNALLELCNLVNAARKEEDASPLELDASVMQTSQGHADDMALRDYFSHTCPEGKTFIDRLRKNGVRYRAAAENIAYGQKTAQEVLDAWLKSPGHRANLMNPRYRRLGLGLRDKRWVQNFTD